MTMSNETLNAARSLTSFFLW